MQLKETFERVKCASRELALLSDGQRNEILLAVANAILENKERILDANARDLAKMSQENPLYDRLQLTGNRLDGIACDMRNVASLPSPLGAFWSHRRDLRSPSQCHFRRVLALL